MSINTLYNLFKKISACDAWYILCRICGADQAFVILDGRTIRVEVLSDIVVGHSASEISLSFYGGPPGATRWREGTMLTLLLDHLAFSWAISRKDIVRDAIRWHVNIRDFDDTTAATH